MSNKQLDESNIVNELKGSSLFFRSENDATPSQSPENNPAKDTVLGAETAKGDLSGVDISPTLPSSARAATTSHKVMSPASSLRNEATPVNPTPTPVSPNALGSNNATNERPVEPPLVRSNERRKIRHTFDILADQLLALREIAVEREKLFGDRVLLGDLVQQALDMLIAKERNQP